MSTIKSETVVTRPHKKRVIAKKSASTFALHILLTILGFGFALPFIWMVLTSLKPLKDIDSRDWLPEDRKFRFENYRDVFDTTPANVQVGEVTQISKQEDGTPVYSIKRSLDGDVESVALDRKTKFYNMDGLEIPIDSVQEGMDVRLSRPAGDGVTFGRFYWNSIFVASWVTFLQVMTSAFAAYAFARLKWRGRDKLFFLYLATMMLPGLVMMIPNYQVMIKLGLVDTYIGLIIPAAFTAFGTFLMRQFMLSIPTSLDEAAEIDGANKWQIFWDVIMPLSRPGLITLTIFTFMGNYNSFTWPLVMLRTTEKYTLPIGMLFFDSSRGQATHLLMAAIAMSVLPMVLVYILLQKHMVKGIQLGAVKG
ncbi:MAG: carbohydrate ABC transporter permease [Lentisphaerae bacterium]|jgi:multiple sugar transport system permease protein|nr:carbohydrate ABC transporter permease [Lentisphaerota bacterium]